MALASRDPFVGLVAPLYTNLLLFFTRESQCAVTAARSEVIGRPRSRMLGFGWIRKKATVADCKRASTSNK